MGLIDRYRNRISGKEEIVSDDDFQFKIKLWFPFSVAVGLAIGAAMSLFLVFTVAVATVLQGLPFVLATGLGGTIVILLAYYGIEDPQKNGISYVILSKHQEKEIEGTMGGKKFLSSGIALGSGLPMGREGPALIIGSAIANYFAKLFKLPKQAISRTITIGSAASTGALFQAPLGSAIFAAEVPYKEDSDEPMMMAAFLASITAAVFAQVIISLINQFVFPISLLSFQVSEDPLLEVTVTTSILAFVFGIGVGLVGRGFIWIFYKYTDHVLEKQTLLRRLWIGLAITLTILVLQELLFEIRGVHHSFSKLMSDLIEQADTSLLPFLFGFLLIQIFATTAIVGAGFPGGIFAPSLIVGGVCGIIFSLALGSADISAIAAWAIVGMSASHAATTKTPIASVLLILEITGLPKLIIPIVLANLAAYIVSGGHSLYRGQLASRDAKILAELANFEPTEMFTIEQVMTPRSKVVYVTPEMVIKNIKQMLIESGKRDFPVVEDNKVVGMLHLEELDTVNPDDTVSKHIDRTGVTLDPSMDGKTALFEMINVDVERAAVVNDEQELLGIVSLGDILQGRQKLEEKRS